VEENRHEVIIGVCLNFKELLMKRKLQLFAQTHLIIVIFLTCVMSLVIKHWLSVNNGNGLKKGPRLISLA
jgi:hypothetical protein